MQAVGGSETVLVVDDEISVLSLAHAMLRRYGYTVIGAPADDRTHKLSDQEAGDAGFSAAQDTVWLHGGTISVANGSGSAHVVP